MGRGVLGHPTDIDDFVGAYERFAAHPNVRHWDNPRIKDYADTCVSLLQRFVPARSRTDSIMCRLEKALEREQFRFSAM
jgi:hypothetical protein